MLVQRLIAASVFTLTLFTPSLTLAQRVEQYKNLNPAERSVLRRYHAVNVPVLGLEKQAQDLAIQHYGNDNDDTRGNAFKHCYWMGAVSRMTSIKFAKAWGDAHEAYWQDANGRWRRTGQSPQKAMDLYNNEIGRAIGYYVASRNGGFGEIAIICRNLERQNKLRVLKP